jgi:type VI protein secretion system component Hcp
MIDGVRTGDDPAESISMTYGKIEFDYTQLKSDGSSGGSSDAGWDLKNNKAA